MPRFGGGLGPADLPPFGFCSRVMCYCALMTAEAKAGRDSVRRARKNMDPNDPVTTLTVRRNSIKELREAAATWRSEGIPSDVDLLDVIDALIRRLAEWEEAAQETF